MLLDPCVWQLALSVWQLALHDLPGILPLHRPALLYPWLSASVAGHAEATAHSHRHSLLGVNLVLLLAWR